MLWLCWVLSAHKVKNQSQMNKHCNFTNMRYPQYSSLSRRRQNGQGWKGEEKGMLVFNRYRFSDWKDGSSGLGDHDACSVTWMYLVIFNWTFTPKWLKRYFMQFISYTYTHTCKYMCTHAHTQRETEAHRATTMPQNEPTQPWFAISFRTWAQLPLPLLLSPPLQSRDAHLCWSWAHPTLHLLYKHCLQDISPVLSPLVWFIFSPVCSFLVGFITIL